MATWLSISISVFITIFGVLLSFVLAPMFGNNLSDRLNLFFAKNVRKRGAKKKMNLTGDWNQKWLINGSAHFPEENETSVKIFQRGNKVYGEFKLPQSEYSFTGTLDKDMYLTGIWEDLSEGNNYKGAFQLYIHKYERHMTGKWIGYSEKHIINTGDWLWKRENEINYLDKI